MKLYQYDKCSTCSKAKKYLNARGIDYTPIAIRDTPPTLAELKKMLAAYQGDLKRLFNTSGQDYRTLGIKDRLKTMTPEQALELLSQNGNLVKRPFVIAGDTCLVGFQEDAWDKAL